MNKIPRILVAKLGLDGHNRGALMVMMALRDAGMEVIYTGLHQTPEAVAEIACQEDVDLIGVSSLADAHRTLIPRLIGELAKNGDKIPVMLGGFIQPEDIPELKRLGVIEVFGPLSKMDDIVKYVQQQVGA